MFSLEIPKAFFELHDSLLLELDAERRVRAINSRGKSMLGAGAFAVADGDWLEIIHGENERERARLMLECALESGGSCEQELDAVGFEGTRRRLRWRCVALRAVNGAPAGWLCSGTDVTDRALHEVRAHVTQDRLTRVARLATMGEMAAGVAHELNQPLMAITTYACACERYLEMAQPDFAELRAGVREIIAEGLRAGEIIRRLRQMVRSDDADERAVLDVNTLIEELRTLLVADARVHDAALRIELAPHLPLITANAAQLQQVILNLARNAFEALLDTAAGTRDVRISTMRLGGGDLEIRVTDNGPGLAPHIEDRLFTPFATTKRAGTGLGLAISRTIVQTHGGTIGARKGEPRGTIFFVRLPALEECLT